MKRRFTQLFLSSVLLCTSMLLSGAAVASHMRAAVMNASITASGAVTGTLLTAWAKDDTDSTDNIQVFALSDTNRASPLASLSPPNTVIDATDPSFDVASAPFAFNFGPTGLNLAAGTYVIRRDNCCRIGGIANGAPSDLSSEATVTFGSANRSPVFASTPYARVARSQPFNFFINGSDPDGGSVSYALVTNTNFPDYGAPAIAGLTLNTSTGQLSMSSTNTAALTEGATYAVKVRATDSSGAFADWDVLLIALTTSNVAPVIAAPAGGASQTVMAGQSLVITISSTDADAAQNVTLQAQGLPANATFTPNAPGNPTGGTIVFNPQPGQAGQTFGFNIVATDNDQTFPLSTTLNMQISVTAARPVDIPTMNQWMLMLLATLVAGAAWFSARRNRA